MPHFLEFLRESEGAPAATNATDGVATAPTPLFSTSRFGTRQEYTVPHEVYMKLRNGRERNSPWADFIDDEGLRETVRKTLYEEGCCLVTSGQTGSAIFLRHEKMVRKRYDDEITGG